MLTKSPLLLSLLLLLFTGCSFKRISQSKNIVFDPANQRSLDVYAPKQSTFSPVLIFIHGGNWIHGNKSIYKFLGKRMAKKGIVTVVMDYRKGQTVNYEMMTTDAANAIKWTFNSIETYGGDKNKLFVSGHSAGGHLAALVASDTGYFKTAAIKNPLKGVIVIDAFGLDMHSYLKTSNEPGDSIYFPTFSHSEETWKKASPISHLNSNTPSFLLFMGTHTYPGIKKDYAIFYPALKKVQPNASLILQKRKNHYEMIFQFLNPWNKSFDQILDFMKNPN